MDPEKALKQIMVDTFNDSVMPDVSGEHAYREAAAKAAKVFKVKKPTFNQLKAYLLFGDDAADIKEEIRFLEEK